MLLADFDYDLPERLIARAPTPARCDSRMLVVEPQAGLIDRRFADLPQFLQPNDLLVLNDTRVIKARLRGHKHSGGRVEALIERIVDDCTALALLRSSKTPKPESELVFNGATVQVRARDADLFTLEFPTPVASFLEAHGEVPLPPYLKRDAVAEDEERYQTVYAERPGAVAAPTAGLHFDRELLGQLAAAGVRSAFVTLHVGAGTFQNLTHERVDDNRLHAERVEVSGETCDAVRAARRQGGRVVAVGTTSVRALESAAVGADLKPFHGETDLFIRPGFRFRAVDALITNFHLPRSSLLMLVAAFAGTDRVLEAYRHAVQAEYRFFSYGDAMLLAAANNAE